MRRVLFTALDGYRRASRWWARARGHTPEDAAEAAVLSGTIWEEFCDGLKAAGAALEFPGTPKSAFDRAEGYRYLSRLTRAGLEAFLEHADPLHPVLHRVVHETVKMGSDNPDNYYMTARISGAHRYRIRGRRNTVHYLAFGTQSGHYGQGGGLPPTGRLEASEMHIEDDGSFEITLSVDEADGNWLPMTSETGTLVVRQTFLDRSSEEIADLEIECISPGAHAADAPLTPAALVDGLRSTSALVAGASLLFAKWARDFQAHSNELPLFDVERSNRAGGDPNIRYYHSHWALDVDEALVIETTIPSCEHWNFQLNNYWMESLDYRYHRVHVNKHSAGLRSDGSVRIIVAHEDPLAGLEARVAETLAGETNWIRTLGHRSGTMCFRWVRADEHPQPRTRVVQLSALRAELSRSRS